MARYDILDVVFSTLSWIVVLGLFSAGVNTLIFPPTGIGPIGTLFGVLGAQVFYLTVYWGLGIALAVSKLFRTKKIRKHVLMVTYLVGIMTTLLSFLIIGFSPKLIDNVLIVVVSAVCWLYWKFKTEYLDAATFDAEVEKLREDLPPRST